MAPHPSTLAWKIPWMEEPGRLQSMGSLRVGHDWVTSLSLFTFLHCKRKWQPTPGFLPGESQGPGSLVGCRLLGLTESDTTEATAPAAATRPYYRAQETLLSALWWPEWEGNPKERGYMYMFMYMCTHLLSHVQLFPTVAHQASLSMEFSRQEY